MTSGSSVKTTQDLMRHATAGITLELHEQVVSEDKREAQDALAALIAGQTIPAMQREEIGASA